MISKKDNIAEYILHMWQMEDLVRAFPDDEALEQNAYLSDLKNMMRSEGVLEHGHVQLAQIAVDELNDLHRELYDTEAPYRAAWIRLMPSINLLKAKTDRPTMSDIEACLLLLYQIMLLRLQKREISPETASVQQQATQVLQFLSKSYRNNEITR